MNKPIKLIFGGAVIFFTLLRFLSSCSTCYECTPKGSPSDVNPLEVCKRDDEDGVDFDIRVNRYRKEGYVCN